MWLQDGTELRYAVGKGDGERIVRLDGEAYFDVSHDARHPFVVETRELAIRVLGTAFNVRRSPATRSRRWCSNAAPYASKPPAATTSCGCIPTSAPCTTPGWATWRWPKSTRRSMVTRRYNLVTMKGATITEIIAGIEKSYGVRIRIMSPDERQTLRASTTCGGNSARGGRRHRASS